MSTDYVELYKRLYQEILKSEKSLDADVLAFIDDFVKTLKAEGWELNDKAQGKLADYITVIKNNIATGIATASSIMIGKSMASATVLKLTEQAFTKSWQDGQTLSDRLWKLNQNAEQGIKNALQAGIAQGEAGSKTVYAIQRAWERESGKRFIENYVYRDDWALEFSKSAKAIINTPKAHLQWSRTLAEVKAHIEKLSKTGTRIAAERLFSQMTQAVKEGNVKLIEDSLKWWGYDKQLYYINRIVRTEMANAAHTAVIDSTIENDVIIGYQWRLSGTHDSKSGCVCSQYANVEMGLGKGVFTKAKVPRSKPHPHCMCLLVPRATKIKTAGQFSFEQISQK